MNNAASRIEPVEKREEREFVFRCRHVSCGEEFTALSKAMAGARAQALKAGWDFRKLPSLQGPMELWMCPVHAAEVAEKIKNHRAKKLVKYSTEAPKLTEADEQIAIAEKRHQGSQTSFERAYSRILNAGEMTACGRLRDAMTIVEIAGNACMSYEPVSVDSFNYGSKTIAQRVVGAQRFVTQCKKAVVGEVQRYHHDAWHVLVTALVADLTVQATGDMICRARKDKRNEKARRELAAVIVQKSAAAIIDLRLDLSGK